MQAVSQALHVSRSIVYRKQHGLTRCTWESVLEDVGAVVLQSGLAFRESIQTHVRQSCRASTKLI